MGKTYEQKERDRQRGVEMRRKYTQWHRTHPGGSVLGGGPSPPSSSDPDVQLGIDEEKAREDR
ncbi:MAG: hypothetical protein HY566_01695 [Candidatus Kerfeldbacteria bacterium]|nr:hypothetical protein [Candidatus Kerfeldbacteria bacterium]